MRWMDWVFVFLCLFWLRELANPITRLITSTVKGSPSLVGGGGDEANLENYLDIQKGIIAIPLATVAFLITFYVIFKIMPKPYRFTFITAGLLGGVFGFWFWLFWIGPILIP